MSTEPDSAQAKRNDPRGTQELIQLALTEPDEWAAWEPVTVLHYRGSGEVLGAARLLCRSGSARERALGANILGQLGVPERTFAAECFDALAGMLGTESDPEVLRRIGVAFGHLHDARAIELLVPLKSHPIAEVRRGVVSGLSAHENASAIAPLIELTGDADNEVRDGATFAIGSLIQADTPEIRDALYARTTDAHGDTRGEALVGLARRKDGRAVETLIRKLESDSPGRLALEAAEAIGDSRLYPSLAKLKSRWPANGLDAKLLEDALAKCRPESK
jgi:HEAT repeat protein